MKRLGNWFINKDYDIAYLITKAPVVNTVPRFVAAYSFRNKWLCAAMYFRKYDGWRSYVASDQDYQKAIMAVYENSVDFGDD
jgi:hypothetical protein